MKKTIGKSLAFGFAGAYSQQPDSVITTQIIKGDQPVYFGDPVMLDADGFVRAADSTFSADNFVGIASKEIRSAVTVDNMDGVYRKDDAASVMTRGAISVICQTGAPKKGGAVYVRIGNPPTGKKVGGFEAAPDGTDTAELPNCVWISESDSDNVSEIRMKTINLI